MGDDPGKTGVYSFSLSLRNDSTNDLHYTDFEAYIMHDKLGGAGNEHNTLTSAYAYCQNDEKTESLGCSGADISYRVNGSEVSQLHLAPGESVMVWVRIRLSEETKAFFDEYYENGSFVEGYVVFREAHGEETHATFLAYYGDWTEGEVLEKADFRDVLRAAAAGLPTPACCTQPNSVRLTNPSTGEDFGYAGQNLLEAQPFFDSHVSFSTPRSDGSRHLAEALRITPYLLRNTRHLTMTISDKKTGEVYRRENLEYLTKSTYEADLGWQSPGEFFWNGTDQKGKYVPSGTVATISFDAVLPYRQTKIQNIWRFDVTVDDTAPLLKDLHYDPQTQSLMVTAYDENYLQSICISNTNRETLGQIAVSSDQKGAEFTASFSVESPGQVYVTAMDYATNERTVLFEIPEEVPTPPVYVCFFRDFSDCTEQWYHEAVDYAVSEGLMNGIGEGLFDPKGTLLRSMTVTVLHRAAGSPSVSEAATFSDVTPEQWYSDAINWAYENKIVNGVSETKFGLENYVTREQLTTMLLRYAAYCGHELTASGDLSSFADADSVSDFAVEAMCWAVAQGIMNGDGGRLNPQGNATRAQCAKILICFLDLYAGRTETE